MYHSFVRMAPQLVAPTILPNYSVCSKIGDLCTSRASALKNNCVVDVKNAFQAAGDKCNGYKRSWITCFKIKQNARKCKVEGELYDICVKTFVGDETVRWKETPCIPKINQYP